MICQAADRATSGYGRGFKDALGNFGEPHHVQDIEGILLKVAKGISPSFLTVDTLVKLDALINQRRVEIEGLFSPGASNVESAIKNGSYLLKAYLIEPVLCGVT